MNIRVNYKIRKNRRAKALRIRVVPPGEVIVSAPPWLTVGMIDELVKEKAAWIKEKLVLVQHVSRRMTKSEKEREYQMKKVEAQSIVEECITRFNQFYQFQVGRITIRNQKTRWGSCSSQGNLSFNYQIVNLRSREQDYIVVHELCHLREMNHSPRFWALVEKTVPEYRLLRKSLRKQRHMLSWGAH